jgi:hypothetical protein
MYMMLKVDLNVRIFKLPFTCNPTGVAAQTGLITDIILWKNSTSGWKQIVKIWLNSNSDGLVNEIEWINTDIRLLTCHFYSFWCTFTIETN